MISIILKAVTSKKIDGEKYTWSILESYPLFKERAWKEVREYRPSADGYSKEEMERDTEKLTKFIIHIYFDYILNIRSANMHIRATKPSFKLWCAKL